MYPKNITENNGFILYRYVFAVTKKCDSPTSTFGGGGILFICAFTAYLCSFSMAIFPVNVMKLGNSYQSILSLVIFIAHTSLNIYCLLVINIIVLPSYQSFSIS